MARIEAPKHTVIIDADLHIQDPHDIILSYFNTQSDSQFIFGPKRSYLNKIVGIFVAMVLMKFFFEEMFSGFFMFVGIAALSVLIGFITAIGIDFFVRIVHNSTKNDGLRGLFYQITFMTIIVLVLGIFI